MIAGNWEISLGRFLQPIWAMISGHVTMPWLTGVVSIIFLSISAWFCIEILNIKSNIGIINHIGFFVKIGINNKSKLNTVVAIIIIL